MPNAFEKIANLTLWSLGLGVALALCSCATSYRVAKGRTGYAETQTSTNSFAVSFQGNVDTTLEQVYDFALLRSAELSLAHDFPFFAVLDVTNTSSAKRYTSVYTTYGTPMAGAQDFGRYDYIAAPSMVQVQRPGVYYKPGTVLYIRCYQRKPEHSFAYDAKALQETLRRKYKLRLERRDRLAGRIHPLNRRRAEFKLELETSVTDNLVTRSWPRETARHQLRPRNPYRQQ